MSAFDAQFAAAAHPAFDSRLGDDLTIRVAGDPATTVACRGIVEREADEAPVSDRRGRNTSERAIIDILTVGVTSSTDDVVVLPSGDLAHVVKVIQADQDGQYPRLLCNITGALTSKNSRARP